MIQFQSVAIARQICKTTFGCELVKLPYDVVTGKRLIMVFASGDFSGFFYVKNSNP